MPLSLHVEQRAPRRRFVDTPSPVPAWRLLHREADALYPELRTVWHTLFADTRDGVDRAALAAAIARGNLVEAENLLSTALGSASEAARRVLPALLQQATEQTITALLPDTAQILDVPLRILHMHVVVPEALAAIDAYAGTQIVAITQQTLQAIREVIRQGFAEGLPLTEQMEALSRLVGLTARQQAAFNRVRQQLQDAGRSASQIRDELDRLARTGLQQRVETIARTESIDTASRAQQALWEQSERAGFLDSTFKRYWIVTPDDRLCPICEEIPGLNPDGVDLHDAFRTPVGPIDSPTAHPRCRCAVSLRRG